MHKYLVEFIGTFFLVATIGFVAVAPGSAGAMAPLAIGILLTAIVYAGGPVSDAHYNPAVTIAMLIRGRSPLADVLPYIAAQLFAAVGASFLVLFVKGHPEVTAMTLDLNRALVAEIMFTFALVWVILQVATTKASEGNSYFGIAIGSIVAGGVYAVGGVSGGVFNPAVAVAVSIMGLAS